MSKNRRRALAALIAGLAMPTGMIAAGAAANGATLHQSTARTAVEICGTGAALVRPSSVILTCADNGELAEHLHWSTWTRSRATASGTVTWRTGSAAPGSRRRWQSTSAQFTLINPVPEPGGRVLFTRLRLHVTGSTPPGFMRNLTFDVAPATAPVRRPSLSAGQQPATGPAQPTTAAPSGTLSYADIEGFWIDAGGPSSVAETAAAITGAESSFLPGVIQPGVDYCGSGSDRAGWGLWQITCGNSVPAYGTDFQILDPWNNAEAAVSKYNAGGFSLWTTYTSGAYQQYLQNVTPNTKLTDPGEYVQVNSTPSGTPASPAADPGGTYGAGLPGSQAPFGPAAGSDSSKNLYAFWKGTNGGLWENNRTGSGTWTGAHEIPGMGPLGSQPTVAVSSAGNQYVYWEGTNGNLYEAYYDGDGSWHGPAIVTDTAGNKIGSLGSAPTAGVDGSGNVYVFWENASDQGLEEASGNGVSPLHFGSQHEIPEMGPLGSAPAVAVSSAGNQYVYWEGTNGNLYEAYYDGDGSWHGPAIVTDTAGNKIGSLGSAPTAGVDGSGNVYVFWENASDHGLEEASGNGVSPLHFGSQHEIPKMGPLGSAPAVAVDSSGQQHLFWKGTGSADLWFTEWLTSGGWQPTRNLGGGPLG